MKSQSAEPIWIVRFARCVQGIKSECTQHIQGQHNMLEAYAQTVMPGWAVVHVERRTDTR